MIDFYIILDILLNAIYPFVCRTILVFIITDNARTVEKLKRAKITTK